jgi:outer membrane protein assembly factor BamA
MKFFATALCVLLLSGAEAALAAGDQGATGSPTAAQTMEKVDAQIKQKLESQGYANIQITGRDKGHIDVTATKNGKTEKLAVNPETGVATPDTDED